MPVFTAGSASVSIVPDFTGAQRAVDQWFARQGDYRVNVQVDVDQGAISKMEAQVKAYKPTINIDVDKAYLNRSILGAINGLTGLSTLAASVSAVLSPAMFAGAAGGLTAIAASAGAAGAAVGLLPGVFVAAAAPIAALVIGTQGVGDAFKAVAEGDAAKLEEALAKLSPAARNFVTSTAGMAPAFTALKLDVQERLFAGLGARMVELGGNYMPILRTALGGIAEEFNRGAQSVFLFLNEASTVSTVGTMLDNVRAAVGNLTGGIGPLVSAFTNIAAVGSGFLPGMTSGFRQLTIEFSQFIIQARESGQLAAFMQSGIDALKALGALVLQVGGFLVAVFQSAAAAGGTLIQSLTELFAGLNRIVSLPLGQAALSTFFQGIAAAVQGLLPGVLAVANVIITNLLPAFGGLLASLGPLVGTLLTQFAGLLASLAPIIPMVAQAVVALLNATTPLIPVVTQIVTALLPQFAQLAMQLAPIIGELANQVGAALLRAVQLLAPYLPTLAQAFVQIVAAVAPLLPVLLNLALQLLPPLLTIVMALVPVLVNLAGAFATMATAVAGPLGGALSGIASTLAGVLVPVLGFLANNIGIVVVALGAWLAASALVATMNAITMLGGLNGMIVRIALWIGQLSIVTAATTLWTAAQAALNFVMSLNPIGIVVIALAALAAALYVAWTSSETFRSIVLAAWEAIRAAAVAVFQNVLLPIWAGLQAAWSALGTAIQFVWSSIILPVWGAIQTAASALGAVLGTIWAGIQAGWSALGAAFSFVWTSIIMPVWDAISLAARVLLAVLVTAVMVPILLGWQAMAAGFQIVYQNVILPLWNVMQIALEGVRIFFTGVWTGMQIAWAALGSYFVLINATVIQPLWNVMQVAIDAVRAFFVGVWNGMQIAWAALGSYFTMINATVIQPLWNLMQSAMDALRAFLMLAWANLQSAWNVLGVAFRFVYDTIIQPLWNGFQIAVGVLQSVAQGAWNLMQSGWEGLGRFFRMIYDTIIQPAWDVVASSLTWLRDRFDDAVRNITSVWDGLKAALKGPVVFLIDTVWNGAIKPAWDLVAGLLSLPKAPTFVKPPGFADGGIMNFAGGGRLRGKWRGPRADNLLGIVDNQHPVKLNTNEFVQPDPSVRQYGVPFMEAVRTRRFPTELAKAGTERKAPRRYGKTEKVRRSDVRERYWTGGLLGHYAGGGTIIIPGFAQGTIVDLGKRLQAMGGKVSEHPAFGGVAPVHSANSLHYSGRAIDVNTRPGTSAQEQAELDPMAALARSLGFRTIWRTTGHFNHLHADDASGPSMGQTGGVGIIQSIVNTVADLFAGFKSKIADAFLAPARAAITKYLPKGPPVMKGVPNEAANDIVDAAEKWFTGAAQAKAEAEGATADPGVPAGTAGVKTSSYGGVLASVKAVGDEIQAKFGGMTVGGFANRNIAGTNTASDHSLGKALDFMTYTNMAKGQQIADYLVANAGRLRSDNVIWNRRIWSGAGWRAYGGVSPHTDHVHYDTFWKGGHIVPNPGALVRDTGGPLPPGMNAVWNGTGHVETVVNRGQRDELIRHIDANRGRWGAGDDGPTSVHVYIGDKEITDMIDVRVSHQADADARYIRSGAR